MEDLDKRGRKQVVQTAVAALCLETGATSVEKGALDAMCQLLESCKSGNCGYCLVFPIDAHHISFRYRSCGAESEGLL